MEAEKVKVFKHLYVATRQLKHQIEARFTKGISDEQSVVLAIENTDKLIAMLPLEFPSHSLQYANNRVLHVNVNDAEDEPQETAKQDGGVTYYFIPENTDTLFESTILTVLEDWKFTIWNVVVNYTRDQAIKRKYIPLVLAQAAHCMLRFPHFSYWQTWEKEKYVLYANQIGWFAFEGEQDVDKLNAALAVVQKGFELSDWRNLKFIKDTKVRLLLKLGRPGEAYPIVREAFKKDPAYADFLDLKDDPAYLSWLAGEETREKEVGEAFNQMVAAEKAKVTNQFVYPQHPLVIQHADVLNLIKHRMLEIRLRKLYKKSGWKTPDEELNQEGYALDKWSEERITAFERTTGLRLPGELKVYLMEIGEGGESYFCYGGVNISWLEDSEDLAGALRPFQITEDKIHEIDHRWGIKAWVFPDNTDWITEGVLKETDDMKALFGLPAKYTDGCFNLGDSSSRDPLVVVMNGVFEGEVWVDTLQYGAAARGCFGPATAEKLKFLAFIAESLLAKQQWYPNASDQGSWM
jgi:hypothetical protein